MAHVSEMLIVGLSLLFGALADHVGKVIDIPGRSKVAVTANTSARTSLRAVDAETVSETEIIER